MGGGPAFFFFCAIPGGGGAYFGSTISISYNTPLGYNIPDMDISRKQHRILQTREELNHIASVVTSVLDQLLKESSRL